MASKGLQGAGIELSGASAYSSLVVDIVGIAAAAHLVPNMVEAVAERGAVYK